MNNQLDDARSCKGLFGAGQRIELYGTEFPQPVFQVTNIGGPQAFGLFEMIQSSHALAPGAWNEPLHRSNPHHKSSEQGYQAGLVQLQS